MSEVDLDDKARKVVEAIRRKVRPYRDTDIAMATHFSLGVVRKRLDRLRVAGQVREVWKGERGPWYELGAEE